MSLSKSTLRRANRVIEIAKALKPAKETGRTFHVTAIYRKNQLVSIGCNSYNKPHRESKFGKYKATRMGGKYFAGLHSEIDAILKSGLDNFSEHTFINVRIGNDGNPCIAKPCANCATLLETQLKPRCVLYTNSVGAIETLNPN